MIQILKFKASLFTPNIEKTISFNENTNMIFLHDVIDYLRLDILLERTYIFINSKSNINKYEISKISSLQNQTFYKENSFKFNKILRCAYINHIFYGRY